jgi:two-component system, NarL family, sensor histidine kinase UhpB
MADDAEMVERALRKAGVNCQIRLVDNKHDFTHALKNSRPDIILSDHSLPSFNSHEALRIVNETDPSIPFILVTATVSEEYAVTVIKEGASDYILKDRLQRLPAAIRGAIEKYKMEAERLAADEILKASERKYRLLFDNNPLPMWMVATPSMHIVDVNEAAIEHYGYTRDEFLQMRASDLEPGKAEEQEREEYGVTNIMQPNIFRHKRKDGGVVYTDIAEHDVFFEGNLVRLISANDCSERLRAEADLSRQRILQQKLITETSIQVQEHERKEIGEELHDNINQVLATAKLFLDLAITKHQIDSEYLKGSRDNIMLAIEEIRKLSHTLVAPSLGDITLVNAIQEIIHEIRLVTPLQLDLRADHYDEAALDKDVKLMLYRIVQEQVNNIIKHAGAARASIVLYAGLDYIILSVADDGSGFDTGARREGIGLRNIRNRAGFYDGIVTITSSPGNGCKLEVKIPY